MTQFTDRKSIIIEVISGMQIHRSVAVSDEEKNVKRKVILWRIECLNSPPVAVETKQKKKKWQQSKVYTGPREES